MIAAVLLVLACSAATTFVLTPLVRSEARQRGWLDHPDGGRKLHKVPVPRLGGLAVYGGFALGAGVVLALRPPPTSDGRGLLHLLGASLLVLGVGLFDDVRGARPGLKLGVQTLAALYLYSSGYAIRSLSDPTGGDPLALGPLALPLTLLWFVAVSNAFNLIDGLDGLASGVALFATTTLFVAAVLNRHWETALLAAALAGALLGFLRYNTSPASIFLGDSGSLFVGFALAGLAVRGHMKSSTAIAVAAPLLALALPLVDAVIAVMRRLLGGRRVFEADGDHIHHRLLRRGLSPQRAVVLLYAVAAFFGGASLLTISSQSQVIGLVVIAMSVATWLGLAQLRMMPERSAAASPELVGDDLHSLWRALVERAAAAGFSQVELFPSEESLPLLERAVRGPGLPPAFPAWRAPTPARSPLVCWRIPLVSGQLMLGTLVLGREVRAGGAAAELTAAIEGGFADRWRAALLAPPSPAPNDAADPVGSAPTAP